MINIKRNVQVAVIGGGLVGSLLAIFLAKRGLKVHVFERRPDMRKEEIGAGRSINLAVSTRGINALKKAGLDESVLKQAIPMRGRMMHSKAGELTFQPYGKDDSEYINSISRAELNKVLMTHAEESGNVEFFFNYKATGADLKTNTVVLHDQSNDEYVDLYAELLFGTDGSASAIRQDMVALPGYTCSESSLDYGYKELSINPGAGGSFKMEKNALHIWPRGNFMLIALPNFDGSFTCTLFLPFEGDISFENLKTEEQVRKFFDEQFSDAVPLLNDLVNTFFTNPTGHMDTVKCNPWNYEGRALLLGDAAHAIVPFFGQGMNCGFEDLVVLEECMDDHIAQGGSLYLDRRNREDRDSSERRMREGTTNWQEVFTEFVSKRKDNTDAIADMAVENFTEMRDKVGDPRFLLAKAVEKVLEKEFPGEYRSRYSIVTFSNAPYVLGLEVGVVCDEILGELCKNIEKPDQVDLKHAKKLIEQKLAPLLKNAKELLYGAVR